MTAVFALILFLATLLLVLVTLVQMLYMESARLRSRDLPSLQFFKDTIEDRIGLKPEIGILTFSLVKHSLLVLAGVLFMAISTSEDAFTKQGLIESFAFAWLAMLFSTYLVPQMLYRHTAGHPQRPVSADRRREEGKGPGPGRRRPSAADDQEL